MQVSLASFRITRAPGNLYTFQIEKLALLEEALLLKDNYNLPRRTITAHQVLGHQVDSYMLGIGTAK